MLSDKKYSHLIAVTGPEKRFRYGWWATRFMLWMCGYRAVYLTAKRPEFHQNIHGIVISGGDDIEPAHYGLPADPERRYDRERDQFEVLMIQRALAAKIPLLGICRGAQLLNVVLQGSLFPDVRATRKVTPNGGYIRPIKWVDLTEGSQLREGINCPAIKVNSLHNQAINKLGEGLSIVGRDRDDIVQAVEGDHPFKLGVQWHPEYLPYKKHHRAIFKYFLAAVVDSNATLAPAKRTD